MNLSWDYYDNASGLTSSLLYFQSDFQGFVGASISDSQFLTWLYVVLWPTYEVEYYLYSLESPEIGSFAFW